MTLAAKTSKPGLRSRGFTLIEIVMVLGIAAIIMGGAVGFMIYSSDERTLRDASGEIEMLAKRARTTAILQQTPYALEFRQGIVRMMPLAQAGRSEKEISQRNVTNEGGERWEFALEGGMELFVRRWNSAEWLPAGKNSIHVWRFDPNGLSEPVSIRLKIGDSWAEDTYHPLTATIRESQLEAR